MRVVFVDTVISYKNPSTNSLCLALEDLKSLGVEIEFWGGRCDDSISHLVNHTRKCPLVKGPVANIFNWWILHLYFFLPAKKRKVKTGDLFFTTGGHFFAADVSWFHYYNPTWFKIVKKGIMWGIDSKLKLIPQVWGYLQDSLILRSKSLKLCLPVSDAIRNDMRAHAPAGVRIETLPNAINQNFVPCSPAYKKQLRDDYGYNADEKLLLFVSQGHYARKGFWRAVEVLKSLKAKYPETKFRFVVLGGKGKKLEQIKTYLNQATPGWEEWMQMVGWTDKVKEYMQLSDALFFPSYFEAFSLIEIEAAATGLPLLLTSHHGSEMILKDGDNGHYLPDEVDEIVEVLASLLQKDFKEVEPSIGRALTPSVWATTLRDYLQSTA